MAYTTIDDPTAYFQNTLFVGNETARSITFDGNTDMQPDLVWIKPRDNGTWSHNLTDSVRGVGKGIFTDLTNAEYDYGTGTDGSVRTFDSNGFSIGTATQVNNSSSNIVAWNWKAGTTSGLSGGSITPSGYSINTTAGFGIYKYTGNGSSGATIAHGLGAVPKVFFIKRLENNDAMNMYNESLGNTKTLRLDRTNAPATSSTFYNDTTPTSSLITLGTESGFNGSSSIYVMYAFAEKQGYSKFSSYVGNGNADGTFVYTGFKPAFIMFKNITNGAVAWYIFDNKRNGYNGDNKSLRPNSSDTEATASSYPLDILSNGFKLLSTNNEVNGSGDSYIYMAFAENPFVTSSGVPACAR